MTASTINEGDFEESDDQKEVLRGPFPDTGDDKLDRIFADAEKWTELRIDDRRAMTYFCYFVRHPRYPECTAKLEYFTTDLQKVAPGYIGTGIVRRTIEDDGRTSAEAIRHIARFTTRVYRQAEQRRAGGAPRGPRPETVQKYRMLARAWARATAPDLRKFCRYHKTSPRTLERARKYCKEHPEGKN
jgi:hypothetical protein